MKFGIDHLFTWRKEHTQHQVLQQAIAQTVLAETLGFDGCWLAEHHFSDYGIVGSLPTMAAALAQATQRIRIGLAVAVLPLAHPLRLAEELAVVDNISNGRLDIGIGRGYQPTEFSHFGIPFEEATDRYREALDILRLAWTEDVFGYDGKFFQFDDVSIFPKPYQKPYPPLLQAAVSSSTFAAAGSSGTAILTSPNFTPIEIVRENFATYRRSLRDNGYDPTTFDYPILQQVYVSEDRDEAIEFPREYAMYYYDRLARLLPSVQRGEVPDDYSEYSKIQRNVEQLKYSFLLEHGINVGTPDDVIERIKILQDTAGVNYYIGWFGFGGMPADRVERSMKLFAEKVMPAFAR